MGTEQSSLQNRKIGQLEADVNLLKRAVMGNGKEGLIVTVPLLSHSVEKLSGSVEGLKTGVRSFLRFQQEQEGRIAERVELKKRSRWLIGILVSANISLLGLLVTMIIKMNAG